MQKSQKTKKKTTWKNCLQGDAQVERINMNLAQFKREQQARKGGSFITAHSIGKNDTWTSFSNTFSF